MASMDSVVSAIGVSDIEPCRGVMRDINTPLSELDVHIEEADVRMFPRALHAVKGVLTDKFRGTRVPQKAIVLVGRPRPYSIIILNMCFTPKASLRASSQSTASSYILERHL